uniref:Minor capsid protein P11 C-terminal conserved region domain-containing protein n=1 Tax=viral metagenome TaxID=1070528 RepID=A0A6C0D3H5_9ZZZZ
MFKQILSGASKFFTKERVLVLVIFLVLAWALFSYSGSKLSFLDGMNDGQTGSPLASGPGTGAGPSAGPSAGASAGAGPSAAAPGYAMQPVANPTDLLPKDQNSQWAALNPSTMNQGDVLMPDLLQAGYHIGLDTIGQTLRNPNLQLRSDPIISKSEVGPWNQSTIEPDYGRVPLELGQGPK